MILNVNANILTRSNVVRKILLIIFLLLFSTNSLGQVFNLVRSINTNDVFSSLSITNIEDTSDNSAITDYSHTGTMTVKNGSVIFNTLECSDNICLRRDGNHRIIAVSDNQKSLFIEDEDALIGARLITIISLTPNIILMETNFDGTVLITEWQPN